MGWGVELTEGRLDSPYGGGDSSGNHKIGELAGTHRLVYRLVPQKTGTLFDVWIETRARSGPNCSPQLADADAAESSSYSGGNPNNWLWEIRFHPLKSDGSGWFDPTVNLVPALQFNPYTQRRNTSFQGLADHLNSALKIPAGIAGFAVTKGTPIVMTIAPANGVPAIDYCSANHLYMTNGREGAQARNEVGTSAADVFYGIDPRMVLGGSLADGSSQWYPGNNFNTAPFTKHLPTFLMVYSDGTIHGQEYFSAATVSAPTLAGTEYTMSFKAPVATTFTHLRAIFSNADSFQATLAVNGVDQGTVTFTSTATNPGQVVTSSLPSPVAVLSTDTITVRFTCNVQNAVVRCYSNGVFASMLGQGSSYYASLTGDVLRVMPVMPVPWPFPRLVAGSAPTGAPATPAGFGAANGSAVVNLTWTANGESYLNLYNVYRNGSLIGTAATNSYSDSTGVNGTTYSYQVSAVALDGRESALCAAQNGTPQTPAVIAYVGARGTLTSSTAATTQVVTVNADTVQGNRLVVGASGRNSGATLSSVTDSRGNTWTVDQQRQDAGSNNTLAQASCNLATALLNGDTVTLHWSASIGPSNLAELHEFSGIAASAVDKTTTSFQSSTVTAYSCGPTATLSQATELGVCTFGAALPTTFAGSGSWNTLGSLMKTSGATSGDRGLGMVYQIVASTTALTATATVSPGQSAIQGALATYKGA